MTVASPKDHAGEARTGEERLAHTLHELRTPLNQIIGLSEMLIEIAEENGDGDLQAGLTNIRLAGLEMAVLVQDRDALTFAQAATARQRPFIDAARAPLSQVLGYADLMLSEAPDPRLDGYLSDLRKIRSAAQRFLTLTRECGLYLIVEPEDAGEESTPISEAPGLVSPALAGARILVVDDESLNREVLCRRLEREGCRPTGVESGAEALRLLNKEPFDAILLDMLMPAMSGLEVLQILKSDDQLRFLPVIMLSAHTEVERVARCLELGAEDYLPKPINSVVLRARLGACLEKQKMAAELLRAGKLQSIGLLAGGLAHDFNNMLTMVLGNLSLLRFNKEISPRGKDCLDAAERGAVRAQELTRYLLTFAEGGAPAKKTISAATLLHDVCHATLEPVERNAEYRWSGELWPIEADPHQLTQVLTNILSNSIEATLSGGSIIVSGQNVTGPLPSLGLIGDAYLCLSVQDNGAGIFEADLAHVFDPFFTTKPNARGLGLALAYSIVQRHGGHLEIGSTVGLGTTATFYLPAHVSAPEEKPAAPAREWPRPNATPTSSSDQPRRVRVLVMDDEPDIRNLVETMLCLLGYDVETAQNGEEALAAHENAIHRNLPFDITLMDLTIPNGMGGAETIKRLRQKDKNIRAIVASGYSDDPVIAHHREYGFNSVLPKPYVMNDLIRVLESLSDT